MNDPDVDGLCLLLMVTTIYPDKAYDPTCILKPGDHEFIKHPSYVLYARADYSRADHIAKMVAGNVYEQKPDLTPEIFERFAQGIFDSDEARRSLQRYAKQNQI